MKTTQRFTLLFSGILSILAPAWGQSEEESAWQEALGSGDFETRNAAAMELWEEGTEVVPFLDSLIAGPDPELAARATTIARKVKLGITPETPEEIVKLIDQYFGATTKGKIVVIEKLLAANESEILLKLRNMETDPEVIDRADEIIEEILPRLVRSALNEGKVEVAKAYLAFSQQPKHLIQYAHLLDQTGELDEEIARLAASKSSNDQARYLACLRVKGDTARLRKAAVELGDRDVVQIAALVEGDHVPYFEGQLDDNNPSLANRYYIEWALANYRGDQAGQKEAYDSLLYLSKEDNSERGASRMALLRMGYGKAVLKSLDKSEFFDQVDFHLGLEEYEEARKLIGVPMGEGFVAWLKTVGEKAKADLENDRGLMELERLVRAVNFLEDRGLVEEATQGAYLLFDLVRPVEDLGLSNYAARLYFLAPVSTYSAIAREMKDHEAGLGDFLMRLMGNADESMWLYNLLGELYEEMPIRERLLLTMSFSASRVLVTPELFQEARDRVLTYLSKEEEPVSELSSLLDLLIRRNREADLLKVTGALSKAGSPNHYLEAILAIDGGRAKEGGEAFDKVDFDPALASSEWLYQKGLILKHAGIEGGEELMKKGLLFSEGGALALRNFAMSHLRYGEVEESYRFLQMALLRSEAPLRASEFRLRSLVVQELATQAVALGKWKDAVGLREVAALDTEYPTLRAAVVMLRTRFHILVARGALAMEGGDIAVAVKAFTEAHKLLPRDGYLANDLFPLLRQLGLRELHDQLFAESARYYRENIQLFPKDDNVYNGFAWLASRANRKLDEAEECMKKALEMNPESAAYLDTMGEIFFARRNREEALKWSKKSLQNDILGSEGGRWELQEQHRRFLRGGFPPE
ncbi:hypothetical protein N9891_01285 [bacterium]|nr:hypothetical protein [bacterium]